MVPLLFAGDSSTSNRGGSIPNGRRDGIGHAPSALSIAMTHDSRPVMKFKSRALKRHEYFNNMLKRYECLQGRFRHDKEMFTTMFESVCVLCQYQMELTNDKLYDVLIKDVMREE